MTELLPSVATTSGRVLSAPEFQQLAEVPAETQWFANMLGRVPLDHQATISYLLMLPLLLIVPTFSAAGLRLAWLAYAGRESSFKYLVVALAVSGAIANWLAIANFVSALWRIFGR